MDAEVTSHVNALRQCLDELKEAAEHAKTYRNAPAADTLLDYDGAMFKLSAMRERTLQALRFVINNPSRVGSSICMQMCVLPEQTLTQASINFERFLQKQDSARGWKSATRPSSEGEDKIPEFAAIVSMALSLVKIVPEATPGAVQWGSSLDNGWCER